jgi:hypothetical protein
VSTRVARAWGINQGWKSLLFQPVHEPGVSVDSRKSLFFQLEWQESSFSTRVARIWSFLRGCKILVF